MAVCLKRGACRLWRGDLKLGQRLVCPTWNRNFRADNVDQIGYAKLLETGGFGNFSQPSGTPGNDCIG